MSNLKCEKCGAKMIHKIDGHTQGWYCTNCEWSVVTTYFSEIELDDTIYKIEVLPNNDTELDNIKIIAKFGNCNFILAKQLLNVGGILLEDRAVNIHEKIDKLDVLGIKYTITPNYPHK